LFTDTDHYILIIFIPKIPFMKRILLFGQLLLFSYLIVFSQETEKKIVNSIYNEALTDRTACENLRLLCKTTQGRITGSPIASAAVNLTYQLMAGMGLDSVYKQPVQVPQWERGKKESAFIRSTKFGKRNLAVAALGMSVGTGSRGLKAGVVEVRNFTDLEKIGKEKIAGKIVFFNRPMDPTLINTFAAYGGAADQRTQGASEAAKFGASAVIVRSLTTALDDFPHTGVLRYTESVPKIPAVAVSTMGADLLSRYLKEDPELTLTIRTECQIYDEVVSANVIGEIRGSLYPEQIITVGGHLDAWDLGEGAHDDGAGCIQSIEVLRLFQKLGIRPKRTIRAVMFMDEEIAQRGGKEYARLAEINHEQHYFAIESDRGGLLPVGIGVSTTPERMNKIKTLKDLFEPYGISWISEGGGGVDVGPLRQFGTPLASVIPDSQRYFDYHHSANDTFEQVNIRELQLGSAAMAALVYLVDLYDL
jgi:carboxypeptidase Q